MHHGPGYGGKALRGVEGKAVRGCDKGRHRSAGVCRPPMPGVPGATPHPGPLACPSGSLCPPSPIFANAAPIEALLIESVSAFGLHHGGSFTASGVSPAGVTDAPFEFAPLALRLSRHSSRASAPVGTGADGGPAECPGPLPARISGATAGELAKCMSRLSAGRECGDDSAAVAKHRKSAGAWDGPGPSQFVSRDPPGAPQALNGIPWHPSSGTGCGNRDSTRRFHFQPPEIRIFSISGNGFHCMGSAT